MEAETGYNPANGDHLIALEKELTAPLTIDVPGQGKITVTLKGTADRIDRVNGHTRIIDYKTGKVEARSLKINDVASVFEPAKEIKEKAFQLLFYLYLAGRGNIAAGD
ncbi:MAG TPA: PD-(D/E)XK nuclease family protein, partial [Lentimicrobium sp.]|nr:PD-(D/E)XK nuclease family protein [Lentimicrobium sp.]